MRRLVPPGHFLQHTVSPPGFRARQVRIYVPSDHQADGTRPALFLFDGQNVFGDEGSFAGGWHAHEAIDRIGRRGRNVPVVVGVDHGNEDRLAELSAWPIQGASGRADAFLDWLVTQLVPQVQSELRLRTGPVGAVIGGSSMGGLASLYAHFRHPQVFGGALAMSPSLWVARGEIFGYLRNHPRPLISRIYLDAGGQEAGGRMLQSAARLAEDLRVRGYPPKQLMWRPDARAGHNERAWRRRLPKALRFMFKA